LTKGLGGPLNTIAYVLIGDFNLPDGTWIHPASAPRDAGVQEITKRVVLVVFITLKQITSFLLLPRGMPLHIPLK